MCRHRNARRNGRKVFGKPAFVTHGADGLGMRASAGESGHRGLGRPDRECDLMQHRHLANADLEHHIAVRADLGRKYLAPAPRTAQGCGA
jgi:hypothetical protein